MYQMSGEQPAALNSFAIIAHYSVRVKNAKLIKWTKDGAFENIYFGV